MTLYLWLKVAHVLAVTIWVGGAVSVLALTGVLLRTSERPRMAALAAACDLIGLRLIAPAGGIAFLTGIVAVMVGAVAMGFWVWWGLVAALAVLGIGGGVMGRGFRGLVKMLEEPAGHDAAIASTVRRLAMVGRGLILLLVVTVAVMVLKP